MTLRTYIALWLAAMLIAPPGLAEETDTAEAVVQRVNEAVAHAGSRRQLAMKLVDRRGNERQRETVIYKKRFDDSERTVLFVTAPELERDTAFLTWDYPAAAGEDLQWLYLPAMRKSRRVSAADRGSYFLGTDFTYEDIKLGGRLEPADYAFALAAPEVLEGYRYTRLRATPHSEAIARELGYSELSMWIDPGNGMVMRTDFTDIAGKPLKQLLVTGVAEIDGVWTRTSMEMHNLKTGHATYFQFAGIDYQSPLEDELFTRQALARGQ